MTFVDTSALYAVLDSDDTWHPAAASTWRRLLEEEEILLTSNYVTVESFALVQDRLGMQALRVLAADMLPVLRLQWITPEDHRAAAQAVLASNRRDLSLVDCSSFYVMHRLGIESAFSFDSHFEEQGFAILKS